MSWLLLLLACGGEAPTVEGLSPAAAPSDSGGSGAGDGGGEGGGAADAPVYAASARADLRLKRWRQVSLDLQGALALPEDAICRETGLYDCTDLHVVPLGGVSVENGKYTPNQSQSITTGLALERVVLQACHNRLALDREATPEVYVGLDLAENSATDDEVDAMSTLLWRRILARDPSPEEREAARGFHAGALEDGADNGAWAAMLCFSLATSTEFLTY